jgi:glycosyltransferase involved in cell wall biosynthesis
VRVLHVAGGNIYGGIERMLATFAATPSHSLAQEFAVSPANRLWRELRGMGMTPAPLPAARASRPFSVLAARRAFARLLSDTGVDAAIFHGSWTHAIFATVARERDVVVAFWQHAPIIEPRWPDRWAARVPPDVVIANSLFTAAAPAFIGAPMHVIHCPVAETYRISSEDRKAGRAALGAMADDVVVLMAARLEALKGHKVLIEAIQLLGDARLKVWIAGGVQQDAERSYYHELEQQISEAGLQSSISLLGEREDVQSLMALADIYCQPNSAPESFGIAIAEAMRSGLPCVVSNTGGTAELVDAESAVLTSPRDPIDVAVAIAKLAADPVLRSRMGRAAAARASRMTDPKARLTEVAAALSVQTAQVR